MSVSLVVLVLVSAVLHAGWNFLLKRARGGSLFVGLSKLAEVVLFLPVFLLTGARDAVQAGRALIPVVLVGATLTLVNYAMLAVAYRRAELSFVYPVSRGGVLLFLPLLGAIAFGERLGVQGAVAIGCIVVGIVFMVLDTLSVLALRGWLRQAMSTPATGLAMVAALATALSTVWDKRAVQTVAPFAYFYTYTAVVGLAYGAFLVRRHTRADVRAEWAAHSTEIMLVGVGNTLSYFLALAALRDGVSTWVVALRQVSVVFGALLGWRLLHEPFGTPKRIGIAMIVGGSVLVALTR